VYFFDTRELLETRLTGCVLVTVAQGNVVDAVMGERSQAGVSGGLLSSAWTGGGHESPSVLAEQRATLPQPSSGVPECLDKWIYIWTRGVENRGLPSTVRA
jgi:hypothetical protein